MQRSKRVVTTQYLCFMVLTLKGWASKVKARRQDLQIAQPSVRSTEKIVVVYHVELIVSWRGEDETAAWGTFMEVTPLTQAYTQFSLIIYGFLKCSKPLDLWSQLHLTLYFHSSAVSSRGIYGHNLIVIIVCSALINIIKLSTNLYKDNKIMCERKQADIRNR